MFNGKSKAVTFSYDDGVTQDQRLIALFNKYGLKGTFNLNSGFLGTANALVREDVTVAHCKPRACEVAAIYRGHEVAAHTLTHPMLPDLPDEEVIRQVEDDRLALSDIVGYEVVGMAYPGGGVNFSQHAAGVIGANTGIRYARTTVSTGAFTPQTELLTFHPTIYHHAEFDKLYETWERFLAAPADEPQLLYIWGHAYEFDIHNNWDAFEDFLRAIHGRSDVFYGTNREVLLGMPAPN